MTAVPSSRRPMMPLARAYAEQAFSRAAGAQLVEGNVLRVLRDARENFPAWLQAIESARERIHLECYIISNDRVGAAFADALIRKVREGVQVRLLYDWVGSFGESGHRYYQRLKDAGVEVRCFNPPRIDDPFGVLSRDHRKMLSVDGRIGFVMGLCLSAKWEGNEAKSIAPWRDTGVSLEGPAVADLDEAFAEVWAATGDPLPPSALTPAEWTSEPGDVAVRVVGTVPTVSGLYRLDLVISALARRTLWLTDAYFVGVPAYVSALSSAARDGVDVRLLVPGASDVPVVSPLSRSGYRPLLESGVRVFEWNGTMLHAKTAVVDGRWARVGSTNLNIQSWLGNYELDVAIENDDIAHELEAHYLEDLGNATEIVLSKGARVQPIAPTGRHWWRMASGSSGRAAASAIRVANSVGSAITNRRVLGPAESQLMLNIGLVLVLIAALGVAFPRVLAIPFAVVAAWLGIAALIRALRLRKARPAASPQAAQQGGQQGATITTAERLS